MKITVDESACMGHAQCEIAAPSLFEIDDDGIARVLQDDPDESLRAAAEDALARCPEGAISITG